MFKKLSEAISHITYFTTFLIVSISLGGLIFFDSFSKNMEYDISIFDLDFYTLFIQVVVLDKSNFIGWGLILFIVLFVIFEFFPKTLNFFIGIFHFIGLVAIKIFKEPFLILITSFFMVLLSFLIILDWCLFDKPSFILKKLGRWVAKNMKLFDHFSKQEQIKIKEKYRMEDAYKDYEKGSFWILVLLSLMIIWMSWLIQFGKIADNYFVDLKNKKVMTHSIFVNSNEKIIKIPCLYVSKVKNGYLVMVKDAKFNKPVIYSDNMIYKLEEK